MLISILYVFRFRGNVRFSSFREYLRKGWPIFTPLNCLLYCFTCKRGKGAIMNMEDFPELNILKENWHIIRYEAMQLLEHGYLQQTADPNCAAYYDVGFRTFYKYGWRKFYLKWYGYTHISAKHLCPITSMILKNIPSVKGAMFSVLKANGKLTRHLDPIASSLRYHLGLKTPNSPNCYINVDGTPYAWNDGDDFLFDETYLHYVENNTNEDRLILMCDIQRPTHSLGRLINYAISKLLTLSIVPNTSGDKQGLVNRLFYKLAPLIKKIKNLKRTNSRVYYLIKYSINTGTTLIIVAILALIYCSLSRVNII